MNMKRYYLLPLLCLSMALGTVAQKKTVLKTYHPGKHVMYKKGWIDFTKTAGWMCMKIHRQN